MIFRWEIKDTLFECGRFNCLISERQELQRVVLNFSNISTIHFFNNLSYNCGPKPLALGHENQVIRLPSFQNYLSVDTYVSFYAVDTIHPIPPGIQTLKMRRYCKALLLQVD